MSLALCAFPVVVCAAGWTEPDDAKTGGLGKKRPEIHAKESEAC